jgi:hypothetical protein
MSKCNIKDLDGIGSFRNLRELYVSFNEISDISEISKVENLEILDLERYFILISNEITDPDQLEYLAICSNLQQLVLEGNPIDLGTKEQSEARLKILEILPSLSMLDDINVTPTINLQKVTKMVYPERPMTSYGKRPDSPLQLLLTEQKGRPQSSGGRVQNDHSSELTHGFDKPVSGSIVSILRSRRKQVVNVPLSNDSSKTSTDQKRVDILSFDNPSRTTINGEIIAINEPTTSIPKSETPQSISENIEPTEPTHLPKINHKNPSIRRRVKISHGKVEIGPQPPSN